MILIYKINDFVPPQNLFFDYLVLYPFWCGILIIIQSLLLFLLIDLFKLFLLPLYKRYKEKIKPLEYKIIFGIVLLSVIYVPLRIIYDLNTISTRIVEFNKNALPENLEGFRIALISDIQADRYTGKKRLERFVSAVNATKPDLILIAGDIITNSPDYINLSAEYLGNLNARYGVYSCVGDHDNWAYRFENEKSLKEVTKALRKVNIPMIDNNKIVLNVDSSEIGITFITNTYVERIQEEVLDSLTNGSLDYDLKIFLTHQPRQSLVDKAVERKYDLFFAGHTHGGQLTFLFPFFNLTPTLIETKYVKGDFRIDDMLMVVTRGLGMSISPVRYNSTPEVTLVILSSK